MLRLPPWFAEAVGKAAGVNLRSPNALDALVPAAEYLSKRFMRQEDSIVPNYFSEADLRRAYLVYFFSTNVLKIAPVLDELERTKRFAASTSMRVLDVGTGVGTAIIGMWMWMQLRGHTSALDVLATDLSPQVCAEAERTIAAFRPHIPSPLLKIATRAAAFETLTKDKALGRFDLILSQNVLVESPHVEPLIALAHNALADNGALVLVEPASRHGSRTLLTFRDALVDAGFTIYAPCVRQADCPALKSPGDWCHAMSRWERPGFINVLDGKLGNLRLSLKYSYLVALKQPLNIAQTFPEAKREQLVRVVSERMDEKGRRRAYICGANGRALVEKQKRDTREGNEAFDDAQRYDLIELDGVAPVSTFNRLSPEGHAKIIYPFNPKNVKRNGEL
jgi:ribosomal protein RSM22 (predicted rRNA methylase)